MAAQRRRSAGLVFFTLLAAALVAIAPPAGARPQATVTLRLLSTTVLQPAQQILIANFERVYPNITVEPQYVDPAQELQILLAQLQAGNAPDVFLVNLGGLSPISVWPLARDGRLLNLSGRPWQKRIFAPVTDHVTDKGKVYAWPLTINTHGIAYNVDLFRQLGLRAPTTFPQLLALCRTVKAAGKVPFALGLTSSLNGQLLLLQQRMNNDVFSTVPKWNALRSAHKVTFQSSPQWRRALQSIVDMRDAGCFNPSPEGTAYSASLTMFARGDAVMAVSSALTVPSLLQINPNLNVAFMNLPSDYAKQSVASVAVANGLAVNAQTKVPNEAKTFIDFMARPKQISLFAKVSGSLSPYDAIHGVVPSVLKPMSPLFKTGKIVSSPQNAWPNPNLLFGWLGPGITGLFTGQRTIDDVLKGADSMWDNPSATAPLP